MARIATALAAALMIAGCVDMVQEEIADEQSATTPAIGFSDSEVEDQIVVLQAPTGVSWSDYNLSADRAASFRLNDGAPRHAGATRSTVIGTGFVEGEDKLDFCLARDGSAEIRILYTPTETVVHVFRFESLVMHHYCRT